ncbi:hypothetical protein LIER_33260 [Lithospermum erythrorhizon]|uniref:Retrotransposon gag domain-containing protein n=1 Tax=Lithospermum erythrorhizon TaxID=34254 RepID=A0AAV3S081_LITER
MLFNRLPEGCFTSFAQVKNRFTKTYVARVRQNKDEHSLMTIRQRKTESIASFQEQFQTDFGLIPGANQKIAVIAFVEGLRMCKFKGSLLKRQPQDLEEVNERAYKYIRTEEAEKRAEKTKGKRPMEEHRWKSPEPQDEVRWILSRRLTGHTHGPTFQEGVHFHDFKEIRRRGRRSSRERFST